MSPDGRFLAYSRSVSREVPEKDIFLVAVDGSSGAVVVQHAANDELVAWSPDGTYLLFNSNRSGQPGLWAQRVQDGAPAGESQLLIANLEVGAGMGVTPDGTLHYSVRVRRRRLKIAELDLKTGRLLRQPVNVTDRFVGSNNVGTFSPDGETLAYLLENRGYGERAIVIRSLKTGEEREIPPVFQFTRRPAWRTDGRLMVQGEDDRDRQGYFELNVSTGQTGRVTHIPDIQGMAMNTTFTPDGTQILSRSFGPTRGSIYSYSVADGSVHALPGVFLGQFFGISPDGQWIAETVGNTEIRLHPAEGGESDVLLTTDLNERFGRWVTWTPDAGRHGPPGAQERTPGWRGHVETVGRRAVDGADPVATDLVRCSMSRPTVARRRFTSTPMGNASSTPRAGTSHRSGPCTISDSTSTSDGACGPEPHAVACGGRPMPRASAPAGRSRWSALSRARLS